MRFAVTASLLLIGCIATPGIAEVDPYVGHEFWLVPSPKAIVHIGFARELNYNTTLGLDLFYPTEIVGFKVIEKSSRSEKTHFFQFYRVRFEDGSEGYLGDMNVLWIRTCTLSDFQITMAGTEALFPCNPKSLREEDQRLAQREVDEERKVQEGQAAGPLQVPTSHMTVYGFTLEQPIAQPPCPSPPELTNVTCADLHRAIDMKDGWEIVTIYFPLGSVPMIVKNGSFSVETIAGKVEAVLFLTPSVSVQKQAYGALINKYGKPSKHMDLTAQNALGMQVSDITATWNFPEFTVTFDGAESMDGGSVVVETPLYQRMRKVRQPPNQPREEPRL
jgi:hypothetical protein